MFGYIIINKGDMKFKEFDQYHSYYCGLCRQLKEKYGVAGQASLSYDMTFLVMLLTSLYEPQTREGMTNCIVHPLQKHQTRTNACTEYAADMNILLTYYKCKDDWEDDRKVSRLFYQKVLGPGYHNLKCVYPQKARRIETLMRELSQEEKKQNEDIDKMSGIFGEVMAEIMAYRQDEWEDSLRKFGRYLGKFIYLMDAYEDIEKDIKDKNYNPFLRKYESPDFEEECSTILTLMMAECSKEFEKLPIIEYAPILRNILYSGVWYRYEVVREKRQKEQEKSQ